MDFKVLIIIPAYNEEASILNVVNSIQEHNRNYGTNYDILVINDGSIDKTKSILASHKIPHVNLVKNLGIGGAVQTGYKYAYENDYNIAIQFDGDGQHEVASVATLIEPIKSGEAEFVIGSRFIKGEESSFQTTGARRMGIKLISYFIKKTTKVDVLDTTSGFRAVGVKGIQQFASSYPTEYPEPITTTELLLKKYKFQEVPVEMHERTGGNSSIHSWKNLYYMINVILSILVVKTRKVK